MNTYRSSPGRTWLGKLFRNQGFSAYGLFKGNMRKFLEKVLSPKIIYQMNNSENYTEVPDRLLFTIHLFLGTKKLSEAIKDMDQLFGSWLWEWLSPPVRHFVSMTKFEGIIHLELNTWSFFWMQKGQNFWRLQTLKWMTNRFQESIHILYIYTYIKYAYYTLLCSNIQPFAALWWPHDLAWTVATAEMTSAIKPNQKADGEAATLLVDK